MEDAYIIRGGKPLAGEVQLSGAKNVALKVIIASLLFDGPVELHNIPHIGDIKDLLGLIQMLGAAAHFSGRNKVIVDGAGIKKHTIDFLHGAKIRVSFMLFAPLLHRLGKASIPNPGGCRIGSRPIDRTVTCMSAFGIAVSYSEDDGYYKAKLQGKKSEGTTFRFGKSTHTGTEFSILLACLSSGESVIENACREPEVDELIAFLNEGGAQISRRDDVIVVSGVDRLHCAKPYTIKNDRNEAVTFALFGLATKGDVVVKRISPLVIQKFIDTVKEAGGGVECYDGMIRFFYRGPLAKTDIMTAVYPGFMTDWQAPWAVFMTQAAGVSTIHETVFENRFCYVDELKKLGAQIEFFTPHVDNPENVYQFQCSSDPCCFSPAIKIHGPSALHGGVLRVGDLRAGASLLIAASVAKGESVIRGASVVDRGYESIDKKLRTIGAVIEKV